jgi:hypothetical protein
VQRRLTGLGFDTKVNGTFDEDTRAVPAAAAAAEAVTILAAAAAPAVCSAA